VTEQRLLAGPFGPAGIHQAQGRAHFPFTKHTPAWAQSTSEVQFCADDPSAQTAGNPSFRAAHIEHDVEQS